MSVDICKIHGRVDSLSWRYIKGRALCERCCHPQFQPLGFVTGTSYRRKMDQEKAEKELTQPWLGDKPNPEFMKTHPQHAPHYFSQRELNKMDAEKMKSRSGEKFKRPLENSAENER